MKKITDIKEIVNALLYELIIDNKDIEKINKLSDVNTQNIIYIIYNNLSYGDDQKIEKIEYIDKDLNIIINLEFNHFFNEVIFKCK